MKFEQFLEESLLSEAPLPYSWSKEPFKKGASFKETVKYAQERAAKLGTGSSRVAFEIPYKGRQTVLKVAKNKKGIAQNYAELQYLEDGYASQMGILIPHIDADEDNGDKPKWIHMEKAEKITDKQFIKYTGGFSCSGLVVYCWNQIAPNHKKRFYGMPDQESIDKVLKYCKDNDVDLINQLIDFLNNYDHMGQIWKDLINPKNWGMYKGHPVIIDIGFDDTTAHLYNQ